MRYYISTCEYKWTHAKKPMELLWVRREVGDKIFKEVESRGWEWKLVRSDSQTMPGDMFCRCDIYVETDESKYATLFPLKYNKVKYIGIT